MRKIITPLFIACIASCTISSCSKHNEIAPSRSSQNRITDFTPNEISSAEHSLQVEYAHYYLDVIGKAAISMSSNPQFMGLLYQMMETDTIGDNNIAIKDLLLEGSRRGYNFESEMNAKLMVMGTNETVGNALNAFKGIEGENLYPQIFIPNFLALKERRKTGVLSGEDRISYFTYADNEDTLSYNTYWLNNGNVESSGRLVDEEGSEQREVWVISLSEDLDSNGNPIMEGNVNGRLGSSASAPTVWAYFEKMTVKEHREPWASGKSEIYIQSYSGFRDKINPATNAVQEYSRISSVGIGNRIRDFKRKEVKNKTEKTINFLFFEAWNPYGNHPTHPTYGDNFMFNIYEKDVWPTGNRSRLMTPMGTTNFPIHFEYRSADNEYCASIVWYFVPNNPYNTGGIKFNSKIQ